MFEAGPDYSAQASSDSRRQKVGLVESVGAWAYLVADDEIVFPVAMHNGRSTARTCIARRGRAP